MGIHGLSTFVQNNPSLGVQKTWYLNNAEKNNDHLIVDGNAFVYHYAYLHRQHWTHGGQYEYMANVIRRIISIWKQAGFTLTFLFDGALPYDKQETRIKRYRDYVDRSVLTMNCLSHINNANKVHLRLFTLEGPQYSSDLYVIPPLTIEVCMQTLRELDVSVLTCMEEADGVATQLAQETQGYVVSKDSDMHIYPDCGKGYIPLDSLEISSLYTNDQHHDDDDDHDIPLIISATIYQPKVLANLLGLELKMLPLFGTLLGNDYLDIQVIKYPIMTWCSKNVGWNKQNTISHWIKNVAEFIRQMNHMSESSSSIISTIMSQLKPIILESGMSKKNQIVNTLEDMILASVKRYDPQHSLLTSSQQQIDISSIHIAPKQYSRQILDLSITHSFWAGVFLEDVQQLSSWYLSRSLRQAMYGWMNMDKINEYVREKQHLACDTVSVRTIDHDHDQQQLLHLFLHHHHVSPTMKMWMDSKIAKPLHPLVICLRYFVQESLNTGQPLANHEVVALLVASMVDLVPTTLPDEFSRADGPTDLILLSSYYRDTNQQRQQQQKEDGIKIPPLRKRSIQLSTQWQHTLLSSHFLAQVLLYNDSNFDQHFNQTGVLATLYNGLVVHTCLQMGRLGASMGRMMLGASTKWMYLFGTLYDMITSLEGGQSELQVEKVFDYKFAKVASLMEMEQRKATISWMKSRILKKLDDQRQERRTVNKNNGSNNNSYKRMTGKTIGSSGGFESKDNAFNVLSFGCQFDE
ncbi:uncharacterized protein BX664DRAFT_386044 [Halteromyces radiatus]|uniref:uncharacterized protein n=1 Tax=Halteromyces radiatus TaxID=101107 RepID=UPI00222058EA|nr:uncharacterized protein BX664DRAFT_386044 [Halteromyces radiatus]KAI8089578.1 hypothetical protein BX664DRAFT_386044 [Halteromyces radiatus]